MICDDEGCKIIIIVLQLCITHTHTHTHKLKYESPLIGSLNAQINANLCNFLVQKC